ncbi:MAG: hypothetical protein AB1430_25310, partial [Pseudomonadota bacterium]
REQAEQHKDTRPEAYQDAVDAERLALQHQQAVNRLNQWVDADRARLAAEAEDRRAGRARDNPSEATKSARQKAADLETEADKLVADWEQAQGKHDLKLAQRGVDRAQQKLDDWKKAHPGQHEAQSDEYLTLLKARQQLLVAQQDVKGGAADQSTQAEKAFIAAHLDPGRRDDPKALYELFNQHAERMGRATLEAEALKSGGGMSADMANRTHLRNTIGLALGWSPTDGLEKEDPAHWQQALRTRDVFSGIDDKQRERLDLMADAIVKEGGGTPTVTVVPIVYSTAEGSGRTALFKVETLNGKQTYVDDLGQVYEHDTWEEVREDFQAHSSLPADDVTMVMPEIKSAEEMRRQPGEGLFKYDGDGHLQLWHGDARTEGWWEEQTRKHGWINNAIAVGGLVAGVVLTVGSGGTLVAAGVAVAAASAYGIYQGGSDLMSMIDHKQIDSASDLVTDRRARMNTITLLGSALGVGALGFKAAGLAMKGTGAAGAMTGMEALTGWGALGTGVVGVGDTGYYTVTEWDEMSSEERSNALFHLTLDAMNMTTPFWGGRMKQGWNNWRGQGQPAAAPTTPPTSPQGSGGGAKPPAEGPKLVVQAVRTEGGEAPSATSIPKLPLAPVVEAVAASSGAANNAGSGGATGNTGATGATGA